MRDVLIRLRNLFCYCGLSKEEYRAVKPEAYESNFHTWKYLHILIVVVFAALTIEAKQSGNEYMMYAYFFLMLYGALVSLLFFAFLDPKSVVPQLVIYLTMILLLCCGMRAGLQHPGMTSTMFIALLLVLSVFMIDKPYFMALLLSVACVVFIWHVSAVKTGTVLKNEILYAVIFTFIGILVNTVYNMVRVRGFVLMKKTRQFLENERKDNEDISKLNATLSAMTSDYDFFLTADPATGEQEVFRGSGIFADFPETQSKVSGFPEWTANFASRFIIPEDRKNYLESMDEEAVLTTVKSGRTHFVRFRTETENGPEWMESRVMRVTGKDGKERLLIGVKDIDQEVQEEAERQAGLKNSELTQIINELSSDFVYVAYVNLNEDKLLDQVTPYRSSERISDVVPGWDEATGIHKKLELLYMYFVDSQDQEIFHKMTRREVIMQGLRDSDYYVNFRAVVDGERLYYQMKFSGERDENGKLTGMILGIRNTDPDTRRRMEHEASLEKMNERIERTIAKRTAELNERNKELAKANEDVVEMVGNIVEFRGQGDENAVRRVKALTYHLAKQVMEKMPEYGLNQEDVEIITSASVIRDIGKITVPDAILLKPGRLNPEQFDEMKTHSERGCEMLNRAPESWNHKFLNYSLQICLNHHEKWDGAGYPSGLRGDEIPIAAQIVSVVDCYNALTNRRVYRDAYSHETAFKMILNGECGAFSKGILDCFKNCETLFKQESLENSGEESRERGYSIRGSSKLYGMRILLVDDDPMSLELNQEILEAEGANVVCASDGQTAVDTFRQDGPFDVVLMDIVMPGMDGAEAIRQIRSIQPQGENSATVIALSAGNASRIARTVVSVGADGWMEKPLVISELSRIVLEKMRKNSLVLQQKLADTLRLANTDSLTHVKNITAYTEKVAELTKEVKNNPRKLSFAVVMCDINNLKHVNDNTGHDMGDQYIKNCCMIICNSFKHSPVYRIGGDEFVAIAQGQDYEDREELLGQLREMIAKAEQIPEVRDGRASMACGMSVFNPDTDTEVSMVVKRADEIMYEEKRRMKSRE